MARRYAFTPARRAALKKAQAKSAAKRKGSGRGRKIAKGVAIGGGLVAAGGAAYVANAQRKNTKLQRGEVAEARNRQRTASKTYSPATRSPIPQQKKARVEAKRRQETHVRQLKKAGQRGIYNAGMANTSGKKVISAGSGNRLKVQKRYSSGRISTRNKLANKNHVWVL